MILAGFFVLYLIFLIRITYKNAELMNLLMNLYVLRILVVYPLGIIVLSYILCIFLGEIFTFIVLLPVFYFVLEFLMRLNGWFELSSYLPQPEPDPNAPRMPIQTPQPHYT